MVEAEPLADGTAASVAQASRLRGEIALPGDKSISHRALMLGLLGEGEPRIGVASDGADVRSTAAIARALGASVTRVEAAGGGPGRVGHLGASPRPRRPPQ